MAFFVKLLDGILSLDLKDSVLGFDNPEGRVPDN